MDIFVDVSLQLLNGFTSSLIIFFFTLLFALPLGLVMAFGSMSKFKPLKLLTKFVVWVLRGTPLMLQIFVIFYVPGLLFGFTWPKMNTGWEWFDNTISSRLLAALVAFIINYAAYFSEIYRGGIESINKGQYEAGQVLGMTKCEIFFKVIFLQVIKRIIPPISNEIITLVKDTSLANVIGVTELMFMGQKLLKSYVWAIFYAGVFYLLFTGILTVLLNKTEKKLAYFEA